MMRNYLVGFICVSTVFFSCKEKQVAVSNNNEIKKAIGKVKTDNITPPIVIPVTQTPTKLSPIITSKPYSLDERMGKEVITTVTTEDGLPLGNYYNITQDDLGNLWTRNEHGLVKYDGNSFHTYQPPGIETPIFSPKVDKQQNIWVMTFQRFGNSDSIASGVFIFNGKSFQSFPELNFKSSKIPRIDLFKGPDKNIWVVKNDSKEILCYDGMKRIKTITTKDFPFKLISNISFAGNGIIWFTDSGDTAITKYDGTRFTTFSKKDGLPDAGITQAIPMPGDSLLLITPKGYFLYRGGMATQISTDRFYNARGLRTADKQGVVWLSNSSRDSLLKLSSSGIVAFGKEDGYSNVTLDLPSIDNQDNIWVAAGDILHRLYRPITSYYDILPPSEINKEISSFLHDNSGNYWFGSVHSGIYRYDGRMITNYSFLDKPGSATNVVTDNNIRSITQDKKGNIWISTVIGNLIKFDGQNFTNYNNLGNSSIQVKPGSLFVDNKDNIWFTNTANGPGINRGIGFFNGKEVVYYTTVEGLRDIGFSKFYEDSKGVMWMGTPNALNRFDGKKVTTYTVDDGLPDEYINDIIEDEYGHLWLCTDDGLSRFDGVKFINYSIEQGLRSAGINSISKSPDKKLFYLNTQAGITAMHLTTADSVSFLNLGKLDGFPIESSFQTFTDREGINWVSENNRLIRLDYNKIKANAKPFTLRITNIRINDKDLCWNQLLPQKKQDSSKMAMEIQHRFGKASKAMDLHNLQQQFSNLKFDSIIPFDFIPYKLVLPISANTVSFDFAAIDPQFSKYTSYQYMLEGLEKTWSPLNKSNNANFRNLREGNYTFKLKALNPYGIWSETSYSFKVLPPWWRTWWAYTLYVLVFVSGIFLFIRWRTKALQKEKTILEEKVKVRTAELNQSLENLKVTQNQLIQSEKMASLGELTAGIAHEIQNPLNFVNNFSGVSAELVKEMVEEVDKGNTEEVKAIANDVVQNLEKINHHGNRAADIVKGMLQHSRGSSGKKEPTDINALCDEYLRLAYHGLRAKDKNFNAKFETSFDESIGKINVVTQDIGRVVLNLINNAFYVVDEKKKSGIENYEPTVSVSTKKNNGKIEIRVTDNGTGIPQKVLDKIFQPFFTTKPTGQGTGLGLSLSYDIVKAHGGELKVETKEGVGSEFIITLPVSL
jgi:signal transduction histidine kinase/ligand-binding sensor domain-containing protein